MPAVKHTLRGSTLAETLVMMLLAGIVFLSVMDALVLFSRLQARRTAEIMAAGSAAAGYYRTQWLVDAADSILPATEGLELYRAGVCSELVLRDSALLYIDDQFCDTLLRSVGRLEIAQYQGQPDTVEIGLGGFTARFALPEQAQQRHRQSVAEIEAEYTYEE